MALYKNCTTSTKNIIYQENIEDLMRIPFKADDFFAKEVNSAFKNIQNTYLNVAKLHIEIEEVAVMLGDGAFLNLPPLNYKK